MNRPNGCRILGGLAVGSLGLILASCGDAPEGYAEDAARSASRRQAERFPFSHDPVRLARFGPETCASCHPQAYQDWQDSHHAKANRPISLQEDAAAFTPTRRIEESGVTYEMQLEGEDFRLQVHHPDGAVDRYDLVGVIGETPIRQYLAHLPGNRLQTISATYDVINDRWVDVFAGQDRLPGEWGHWLGQGMNWNANCAYCHTTEYKKGFDFEANRYASTWVQQGIACAECHGGLEEHLEAARAGQPARGLVTLDREQTEANCATCHSRRDQLTADAFAPGDAYHDHFSLSLPDQPGLYYPDGQILDEVFVHASFQMSRMNHAGVSCMDCHNPHSLERIMPVANNMLCMRCHDGGVMDAPIIEPVEHSFHPAGSTGNLCVECHMSETVYMQEDWRADHGFHSPDPLMTKELGIPNACNKCHTEESVDWAVQHAEAWYGEALAEGRQRRRALAISKAYNYQPEGLTELLQLAADEVIPAWEATYAGLMARYLPQPDAAAHLQTLLHHEDALVRERATNALADAADAHTLLVDRLGDASRSVRLAASRALSAANEAVTDPRAAREWAEYLGFNADRPQSLFMQANMAARENRPEAVETRVRRAIELDRANPEIYHQAAILLSAAGRLESARETLYSGWELAPEAPQFPYSLGLLAAEMDDLPRAAAYLEETVALAPDFYRAWYNLSLAYRQLGRAEDARAAMRRAQGQ